MLSWLGAAVGRRASVKAMMDLEHSTAASGQFHSQQREAVKAPSHSRHIHGSASEHGAESPDRLD